MDSQDHKIITASSTSGGHEGHGGVHLCHRCGWPFPKPHPSSKHRRAHKKVCGKVEGYKIVDLALSDDDDDASGDDVHTPNPKLVKKISEEFGSSGGVGGKSNKSEDDVFADAVAEFSDSGISLKVDKCVEGGDLYDSQLSDVVNETTNDKTKQLKDPPSNDQISDPGANSEPLSVLSSNENGNKESKEGPMNAGHDVDTQVEEDHLASVALDPQTIIEVESKEEICDKSASEVVKHNLSPQTEIHQKVDTSSEINNVADSADVIHSTKSVGEIDLAEEARLNVDTCVEVGKVYDSVKQETSEYCAVLSSVPSVATEVEQNASLAGNSDISEQEIAGNENKEMGSNDNFSIEAVSALENYSLVPEKSTSELLEAGNESGEGGVVEPQLMLHDSKILTANSTDFLSSCDANSDAANSLETTDTSTEKSIQEIDTVKGTEAHQSVDKSFPTATLGDIVHVTSNDVRVESVDVAKLKDNGDVIASETTPQHPISNESELLSKCVYVAGVSTELNHDSSVVISRKNSESHTSRLQEALPLKEKCPDGTLLDVEEKQTSEDVSISKSCDIASGADFTGDVNVATSENLSVNPPIIEEPVQESFSTADGKNITDGEYFTSLNTMSMQDESDNTLTKQEDDGSAINLSNSRSDSLEANYGSVSAFSSQSNVTVAETSSQSVDTPESNCQKPKTTTEEVEAPHPKKSDVFESPSFMTLVQSSEIETVAHNNQLPRSDAAQQAGWFPSLTNVVNESEGRKKNEEIISKVSNWNPVKQHGPLKSLLSEVHSPNTKQIPAEQKDNGKSVVGPDSTVKDPETNKVNEEWNSPARYPIEIKKEKKKKKGKPYWVPFVCCSSVHRDM